MTVPRRFSRFVDLNNCTSWIALFGISLLFARDDDSFTGGFQFVDDTAPGDAARAAGASAL